ncbi:hypothetical protein Q2296_19040 [Leptospira kirschneri]|nr:hypothetical protein [Leptospira kirschneri]
MNEENLKKFRYKLSMPKYIAEISQLTNNPFDKTNLLTLNQTESIRRSPSKIKVMRKFEIPFEEKNSERFSKFLNNLYSKNQLSIYIWTELSNDCGVYRIPSILDFNYHFVFEVNTDGLIQLLSENLDDELIFDFTEDNNERLLEIELSGANWIKVEY